MLQRPPRSIRNYPLFPYTSLFRSRRPQGQEGAVEIDRHDPPPIGELHFPDRLAVRDPGVDERVGDAGEIGAPPERFIRHVADEQGPFAGEAEGEVGEPVFVRSEEHTSELQSLMRISYAVFCLQKKTKPQT